MQWAAGSLGLYERKHRHATPAMQQPKADLTGCSHGPRRVHAMRVVQLVFGDQAVQIWVQCARPALAQQLPSFQQVCRICHRQRHHLQPLTCHSEVLSPARAKEGLLKRCALASNSNNIAVTHNQKNWTHLKDWSLSFSSALRLLFLKTSC